MVSVYPIIYLVVFVHIAFRGGEKFWVENALFFLALVPFFVVIGWDDVASWCASQSYVLLSLVIIKDFMQVMGFWKWLEKGWFFYTKRVVIGKICLVFKIFESWFVEGGLKKAFLVGGDLRSFVPFFEVLENVLRNKFWKIVSKVQFLCQLVFRISFNKVSLARINNFLLWRVIFAFKLKSSSPFSPSFNKPV